MFLYNVVVIYDLHFENSIFKKFFRKKFFRTFLSCIQFFHILKSNSKIYQKKTLLKDDDDDDDDDQGRCLQ